MIDTRLISSKSVVAKIIADLDLREEDIRIADIKEYIGEAMEQIGAKQQLEHKVAVLPVKGYQVSLPCELHRLEQVAFGMTCDGPWAPMRKVTGAFGINKVDKDCCKDKMFVHDTAMLGITKTLYNITDDKEALNILNNNNAAKQTIATLVNYATVPTNNGVYNTAQTSTMLSDALQYSTKPGYIITNVPCGYVKVSYYAIYTDDDGMPMIPDLASYKEAIFWYVAMKISYKKYLTGKMPQYIYHDMRTSWAFYCRQAYAEAMMPGNADEIETIRNVWHTLVPEVNEHDTFHSTTGDEQVIYNQN